MKKRNHKTGYTVYLFGDQFWHRTLKGALRRSKSARDYCNGEHNQVIDNKTGGRQ